MVEMVMIADDRVRKLCRTTPHTAAAPPHFSRHSVNLMPLTESDHPCAPHTQHNATHSGHTVATLIFWFPQRRSTLAQCQCPPSLSNHTTIHIPPHTHTQPTTHVFVC